MSKRVCTIACAVILLFAGIAHGADVWAFREVKVFSEARPELLQILREQFDSHGGTVEVKVDGKAVNACPGGNETLRFTWTFTQDITTATQGTVFSYATRAEPGAVANPCPPGFAAARSFIDIIGSASAGSPFSDTEVRSYEIDRFETKEHHMLMANEPAHSSSGAIVVNMQPWNPGYPDRTFAYFQVQIGTPTGGLRRYVYVYQKGVQPVGSCSISGRWRATSEAFSFSQNGTQVTGTGISDPSWRFSGTLQGRIMTGKWFNIKDSGSLIMILTSECSSFASAWGVGENYSTYSTIGRKLNAGER